MTKLFTKEHDFKSSLSGFLLCFTHVQQHLDYFNIEIMQGYALGLDVVALMSLQQHRFLLDNSKTYAPIYKSIPMQL